MGEWAHGLFGCFHNIIECGIAYLAPCVTMGKYN